MTPLEQAADSARDDREAAAAFYELFATSDLFVPVTLNRVEGMTSGWSKGGERIQLIAFDDDGQKIVPVFDGQERLASWAGREIGVVGMLGHSLLDLLPSDHTVVLNPDGDHGYLFAREELDFMQAVIGKSVSGLQSRRGGEVEIHEASNLSEDLGAALNNAVQRFSDIRRAYVVVARFEHDPDTSVLVLVIKLDQGAEAAFEGIAKHIGVSVLDHMRGYPFEIEELKDDSVFAEAIAQLNIAPFYER